MLTCSARRCGSGTMRVKMDTSPNRLSHPKQTAHRHKAVRGQILIVIALLLPVLLGATALAVDIAVFYYQWGQLQNAADAAALAGVMYLPQDTTKAKNTAITYAQQNGMLASEIGTPTFGGGNQTLSITLTRNVPFYFGKVLGLTQSP